MSIENNIAKQVAQSGKTKGTVHHVFAQDLKELCENRHTDDIQEIITKVPSWILRWGITIFFCILLMAVGVAQLVKYPDTIKGGLKISATGISTPVITKLSGTVTKLFVTKSSIVKRGQPLAIVQGLDNLGNDGPNILTATQDGKVSFAAMIQKGDILRADQVAFVIHPQNEQFFGIMEVPAGAISKVKEGQNVLITLREANTEGNGQLKGKISYIADEPIKGFFTLKVTFANYNAFKDQVPLKSWMSADAEIITQDATILSRISRNILKSVN